MGACDLFDVGKRLTVAWVRRLTVEAWMVDLASRSYIAALSASERHRLLDRLRTILDERFIDGQMAVPYETWLWIATRRR